LTVHILARDLRGRLVERLEINPGQRHVYILLQPGHFVPLWR
jgi:hypothetical protein